MVRSMQQCLAIDLLKPFDPEFKRIEFTLQENSSCFALHVKLIEIHGIL